MKQPEKSKIQFITVEPALAGQRLDNFLRTRWCKGLPKSHLYRIIRKGEVRVNKKRIDPDYRISPGDSIRLPPMQLEPKHQDRPSSLSLKLVQKSLLYEDANIMVINKPAGLAVHAGSGVQWGVIELLRQIRPNEKHLELVHRLDRDTSGCLLLAKKPSVLKELHALLREGKMTKRYILLVKGHWPSYLKYIDQALDKNQLRSGERVVKVSKEGKDSYTTFRVKERFNAATLLQAEPHTGRTHQIRVHAAHAGFPIVGDDKYGDKDFNKFMRTYGGRRLFLHAESLAFSFSHSDKPISLFAPLAEDLQSCLNHLRGS